MKLIDEGYIFHAEKAPGPRRVCFFTSLCRLSSGRILSTFRLGRAKDSPDGNCVVAETTDDGSTWTIITDGFKASPGGVDGEIRAAEIAELDDGTLLAFLTWIDRSGGGPLYDPETDTILPTHLIMMSSENGGRSWNAYQVLGTGQLSRAVLTGRTVHLPGRGWLVPFENFEPQEGGGQSIHSAHALFSRDGHSFDAIVNVAKDPEDTLFYWDQRHGLCPRTGRSVAMFWTYDRKTEKDVAIHMAWGNADELTWEEPFSTGIAGQIAAPIPLPDGRLLAFYVHRHPPGSMRLIASEDGGRTWDRDGEIVIYSSGKGLQAGADGESDFAQYWADMSTWSFGHPAGVVLDDDTLLLSYYAGRDEKCLSARWARVRV